MLFVYKKIYQLFDEQMYLINVVLIVKRADKNQTNHLSFDKIYSLSGKKLMSVKCVDFIFFL